MSRSTWTNSTPSNKLNNMTKNNDKQMIYLKLMDELSSLTKDRFQVLHTDALKYLSTLGQAEPIKLKTEISPKNSETSKLNNKRINNNNNEKTNKDAIRRQRVEQLTRFFMEGRSDIIIESIRNKDKTKLVQIDEMENHQEDGKKKIKHINNDESKKNTIDIKQDDNMDENVMEQDLNAKLHYDLLNDAVDPRIFHPLLLSIRETDSLLYGALLCHPLISGSDPSNTGQPTLVTNDDTKKRRKKNRKEKDMKHPSIEGSSPNDSMLNNEISSHSESPAMLKPDFTQEPLDIDSIKINIARFVAKAISNGSVQCLLLSIKLVISILKHLRERQFLFSDIYFPLFSHLEVLAGKPPPKYNCSRIKTEGKTLNEKVESVSSNEPKSNGERQENEDLEKLELQKEDKLTTLLDPMSVLQSKLSELEKSSSILRFSNSKEGSGMKEELDEEALMAQAIALSLSSDVVNRVSNNETTDQTLKTDSGENEKYGKDGKSHENSMTDKATPTDDKNKTESEVPAMFSADEMIDIPGLSINNNCQKFDKKTTGVHAMIVLHILITRIYKICEDYLDICYKKKLLPHTPYIRPHPLTFLLIHHLLLHLQYNMIDTNNAIMFLNPPGHEENFDNKWKLFQSCSRLTLLRLLEMNFFHIDASNTVPASVGLGQPINNNIKSVDQGMQEMTEDNISQSNNTLACRLKALVRHYMENNQSIYDTAPFKNVGMYKHKDDESNTLYNYNLYIMEYEKRLGMQALVTWARGLQHFYPSHTERYNLLTELLLDNNNSCNNRYLQYQIDLLCIRLSLPDMSKHFVPGGSIRNDDAGTKKPFLHLPPDRIRELLGNGTISAVELSTIIKAEDSIKHPEMVTVGDIEMIEEEESPVVTTSTDCSSNNLVDLISRYEIIWSEQQSEEEAIKHTLKLLPGLFALLCESAIKKKWYGVELDDDFVGYPRSPFLKQELNKTSSRINPRILLLKALQDHLLHNSTGESNKLLDSNNTGLNGLHVFSSFHCAETISLSNNNQTAKQMVAKTWGMVHTNEGCAPGSGVYEWAVTLDKCEKGHVFLGVVTQDASTSTYVGGDKNGYGLIGTKALWHNRTKVRGDYGQGFLSGATVKVKLNTDIGALSFELLSSNTNTEENDWGVAFDGLTQCGMLFPAVGLYQKDDQVTILPVKTKLPTPVRHKDQRGDFNSLLSTESRYYFFSNASTDFGLVLFLDYINLIVKKFMENFAEDSDSYNIYPFLNILIPSLASSLCLVSKNHRLSSLFAMKLLPTFISLNNLLENSIISSDSENEEIYSLDISGKWELKSAAAGNIPAQQYFLNLQQNKNGKITGAQSFEDSNDKSNSTVSIKGHVMGTKIRFLESWRQGGTCIVEARLEGDGNIFSGTYQDSKSKLTGYISGKRCSNTMETCCNNKKITIMAISTLIGKYCSSLLCINDSTDLLLQITSTDPFTESFLENSYEKKDKSSQLISLNDASMTEYNEWINSPLFSAGLPLKEVKEHLQFIDDKFHEFINSHEHNMLDVSNGKEEKSESASISIAWKKHVYPSFFFEKESNTNEAVKSTVSEQQDEKTNLFLNDLIYGKEKSFSMTIDKWILKHIGQSPFLNVGGDIMKTARKLVLSAMLWHTSCIEDILLYEESIINDNNVSFNLNSQECRPNEKLMIVWRTAQRVIEWAIRFKNSNGTTYDNIANQIIKKCFFLLSIQPSPKIVSLNSKNIKYIISSKTDGHFDEYAEAAHSEMLMTVSRFLEAPITIQNVRYLMLKNCTKAFFRHIGFSSFHYYLTNNAGTANNFFFSPGSGLLLQWLSSSLWCHGANIEACTGSTITKTSVALSTIDDNKKGRGYYLGGLGGCTKFLSNAVRLSFEKLYMFLSSALTRAIYSKNYDIMLVLINSWALLIQPEDHDFLSRVNIFRILQTVLDDARNVTDIAVHDEGNGIEKDDAAIMVQDIKKGVVQATLKLVHILAAQIANVGEEPLHLEESNDCNKIPLRRKISGPATLGKSVFNMLFLELKNSVLDLRQEVCNNIKLAKNNSTPSSGMKNLALDEKPFSNTKNNCKREITDIYTYVHEILSLLLSVSDSRFCQTHLSSCECLLILLALMENGNLQIQKVILQLLKRILVVINPNNISFSINPRNTRQCNNNYYIFSFDLQDLDRLSTKDNNNNDSSSSKLILYLMDIVASSIPPSYALALKQNEEKKSGNDSTFFNENLSYSRANVLTSEIVMLLRSLYLSADWKILLDEAFSKILCSIPTTAIISDRDRMDKDPTIIGTVYAVLCVLEGFIDGISVGCLVKINPRLESNSNSINEIALRGTRGILTSYDIAKSTAEVALQGFNAENSSNSPNTRSVRLPLDDICPISDVNICREKLSMTVVENLFCKAFYFLNEMVVFLKDPIITNEDNKNGSDTENRESNYSTEDPKKNEQDDLMEDIEGETSNKPKNDGSCNYETEGEKEEKISTLLLLLHAFRSIFNLLKYKDHIKPFLMKNHVNDMIKKLFQVGSILTGANGLNDINILEENWLYLWSRWSDIRLSNIASLNTSSDKVNATISDDLDNSDDSSAESNSDFTFPPGLREQMMEMGFIKEWCEVALLKCHLNVEAAINFCFENSNIMDDLVTQYKEQTKNISNNKSSSKSTSKAADGSNVSSSKKNPYLSQLSEMGFPVPWCKKALLLNNNNVDAALTWILSNGDLLESQNETKKDTCSDKAPESKSCETKDREGSSGVRLTCVSGAAYIDNSGLVEGLAYGGFASVGLRQCVVNSGKWYYEVKLLTSGCIQIGWATTAYQGSAEKGDGVGDGPTSWAYDGWRQLKWHNGKCEKWGSRKWRKNDVIGCFLDMDSGTMLFSLNGKMITNLMGKCFFGIFSNKATNNIGGGFYPCVSFNRNEGLKFLTAENQLLYYNGDFVRNYRPVATAYSAFCDVVPSDTSTDEDCLEEFVGENYYTPEYRYFTKDANSISSGSGINSNVRQTKSEILKVMKNLADVEIYPELLKQTFHLAILYVRKIIIILLAKWPFISMDDKHDEIPQSFPSYNILNNYIKVSKHRGDDEKDGMLVFLDFLKVISGFPQYHTSLRNYGSKAYCANYDDEDIEEEQNYILDNVNISGRDALYLLSKTIQNLFQETFKETEDKISVKNNIFFTYISKQLSMACQREYANVPWESTESAITTSLLQISSHEKDKNGKSNSCWTDTDAIVKPNIPFVEWLTYSILNPIGSDSSYNVKLCIFQLWTKCLYSPSMILKEKASFLLAGLSCKLFKLGYMDESMKNRIDLNRLINLSKSRIVKEYRSNPICSNFLQNLMELSCTLHLHLEKYVDNTDITENRLRACLELEKNLFKIYGQEIEEAKALAKLELEKKDTNQEKDNSIATMDNDKMIDDNKNNDNVIEDGDDGLMNDDDDNNNNNNILLTRRKRIIEVLSSTTESLLDNNSFDILLDNENNGGSHNNNNSNINLGMELQSILAAAVSNVNSSNIGNNEMTRFSSAFLPAGTLSRSNNINNRRIRRLDRPSSEKENRRNSSNILKWSFPEEEFVYDASRLQDEHKKILAYAKYGIPNVYCCLNNQDIASDILDDPTYGVVSDEKYMFYTGNVIQHRILSNDDIVDRTEKKDDEINNSERILKPGNKVIRGPNWKWKDQDKSDNKADLKDSNLRDTENDDAENDVAIGTVENIASWSGVEGEGVTVRWANNNLYTYRWGADNNYDLLHVEVDQETGKIIKKYDLPKASDYTAGRSGSTDRYVSFGHSERYFGIILHIYTDKNRNQNKFHGTIEWPDFGATEVELVKGNIDMGWQLRFGTDEWQPGSLYRFDDTHTKEFNDITINDQDLVGSIEHQARRCGKVVTVKSDIIISRENIFLLDKKNHSSNIKISEDCLSLTCIHSSNTNANNNNNNNSAINTSTLALGMGLAICGGERSLAIANVGFSSGVHYWEVRIDQAELGSIFLGVCNKQKIISNTVMNGGALNNSSWNKWHGWGFVNFRASYSNNTERIYGDHLSIGDIVGVKLDMEKGKLSFFLDGMKYGEHIVKDMGPAFDNLTSDNGNDIVLYPCFGLRKTGDKVTITNKWISKQEFSVDKLLKDNILVHSLLRDYDNYSNHDKELLNLAYLDYRRWKEGRYYRYNTRVSNVEVIIDTDIVECILLCKKYNIKYPLIANDRVKITNINGKNYDIPEEAIILGIYRDRLWYKIDNSSNSFSNTGGNNGVVGTNSNSNNEEGSLPWYFTPNELSQLILLKRNNKDMTLLENNLPTADELLETLGSRDRAELESFEEFINLATNEFSWTVETDMLLVEEINDLCCSLGKDPFSIRFKDFATSYDHNIFSALQCKGASNDQLRSRFSILRVINMKIGHALPYIRINSANAYDDNAFIGRKLCEYRRLLFTTSKKQFFNSILVATTTITPVPSDEYEDPREIRTIRINRIQAQLNKLSLLPNISDRLRKSVFGQLYRELRNWSNNNYRRSYVGKGHGGQKRAFKVKFLGEGVNDYGGPYRAVFETIIDELQMDYIVLNKKMEKGLLPLLVPCPNRRTGTGQNQDKFLFNPTCGTNSNNEYNSNNAGLIGLELHKFLGKLVGTAVRHGLQVGLDLPSVIWRPLVNLSVKRSHLESIDTIAVKNLTKIEGFVKSKSPASDDYLSQLNFVTHLSDGTECLLKKNGDKIKVNHSNASEYVRLVECKRLHESSLQIDAFYDGLSNVIPMELAPLFTAKELEILICGQRKVDVNLLKLCTEYEDVDPNAPHIKYFWEVLDEMTTDEKTAFLRFVWARSRMPNSAKDFPMNFKIQSAQQHQDAKENPDLYLPHAQTCFFSLSLPAYTSKEVLKKKLLYGILNSPNMDADVRLHNAEGWADA